MGAYFPPTMLEFFLKFLHQKEFLGENKITSRIEKMLYDCSVYIFLLFQPLQNFQDT